MTLDEYPDIPRSCTYLHAEFYETAEIKSDILTEQYVDEKRSFEILRADFSNGAVKGVVFHILQHSFEDRANTYHQLAIRFSSARLILPC